MILTVCPNPCIDYTYYIDDFKAGKLNRVNKKVESLSGKAINVSIAVKRLGYDSYSTGFMFEDGAKKYFEKLSREDVPYIYAMCEGATRINNKIISTNDMVLTEINEKGTAVAYEKQFELIESVRSLSKNASIIVFSGSLPPGIDDDFYYKAGKAVDSSCKIIVDAEGDRLLGTLKLRPSLIKPNLFELETAVNSKLEREEDILRACDKLLNMGARCILVSIGGEGAIIYNGKEAYSAKAPQVEVKGYVGAGDSMVAAACIAIDTGYCLEAILKSAVAAGTAS
ncbi:MAG: 1-phosphofructokinase family hexose kinase, partial [Clostridia bacterium]|nr:1-phosphofructokinase family hexose kinase [Clostridia bacterium]